MTYFVSLFAMTIDIPTIQNLLQITFSHKCFLTEGEIVYFTFGLWYRDAVPEL